MGTEKHPQAKEPTTLPRTRPRVCVLGNLPSFSHLFDLLIPAPIYASIFAEHPLHIYHFFSSH